MVEHHLAKVRVAGSNPVVRSQFVVEWPRGEATACKAVYTGSNPVSTSAEKAPDLVPQVRGSLMSEPGRILRPFAGVFRGAIPRLFPYIGRALAPGL